MSLGDFANKAEVIGKYRRHDRDSGSSEVQIALLTKRLERLAGHFEKHPQDKHSRQGLFKIVSHRKRLLRYLKHKDAVRYREVLANLSLRK